MSAIAGRLDDTTVGDLIAQLYRRTATGTLVIESQKRRHQVMLRRGYLRAVRLEGLFRPLGEVLFREGRISREDLTSSLQHLTRGSDLQGEVLVRLGALSQTDLRDALERQVADRLSYLVRCSTGRYHFEAASPVLGGVVLHPLRLLRGTPRRRGRPEVSRGSRGPSGPASESPPIGATPPMGSRRSAHEVLGAPLDATPDELRRAFRRKALELHPDRHPSADAVRRRRLENQFVDLIAAYDILTSAPPVR